MNAKTDKMKTEVAKNETETDKMRTKQIKNER
jgi:hypothetical protein